jgi:hypothetical protein
MDNQEQIREIMRYRLHLAHITHQEIDLETAALIWIRKYARVWRLVHESAELNSN